MNDDGEIMMTMKNLRLREVRPDHIMKMLQSAADDDDRHLLDVSGESARAQSYYPIHW